MDARVLCGREKSQYISLFSSWQIPFLPRAASSICPKCNYHFRGDQPCPIRDCIGRCSTINASLLWCWIYTQYLLQNIYSMLPEAIYCVLVHQDRNFVCRRNNTHAHCHIDLLKIYQPLSSDCLSSSTIPCQSTVELCGISTVFLSDTDLILILVYSI